MNIPPLKPPQQWYQSPYAGHTGTPIVIDNGATTLRWGWPGESCSLGPNTIAKYKERKTNIPLIVFGDAVDVDSAAKTLTKSAWEGDVLLNFDALENALDFVFVQMAIEGSSVDHPILMSERLCTPIHSRVLTSELLFELYGVPSVAYCVDALMAFHHNAGTDGLVVSFNTASTSVIPVLDSQPVLHAAKRIPWGASQAADYLLKLIQLKYPNFPTRVTPAQAMWMLQTQTSFTAAYQAHIKSLASATALADAQRTVQFPYLQPQVQTGEDFDTEEVTEKRREQGRKLQEMAKKMREERELRREEDLLFLKRLKRRKPKPKVVDSDIESEEDELDEEDEDEQEEQDSDEEAWLEDLQDQGFEDEEMLDEEIKKLETDLKRARKKEEDGEEPPPAENAYPLLDIPDAELDAASLALKKKQKLLKAGADARAKARALKAQEQEAREREREREEKERDEREKEEEEERKEDLAGWVGRKRDEHKSLIARINDRARRRAALSDRKGSAAQARMKNIASLAADDRVPVYKKKGGNTHSHKKNNGEDNFGANDDDWAIYRKIQTNATPSSDEEEDMIQLQAIEHKLLTHDPSFDETHTHAGMTSQRSALLNAWRPVYDDWDAAGKARIHLSTERWRVCEAWFAPAMAGVDCAGLAEVVQNVLSRFGEAERGRLAGNVLLTGGPSQLPGLTERMYEGLRPILLTEMPLRIVRAHDPLMDAWNGMQAFAQTEAFANVGMTRVEYDEYGGERVKLWWGGNRNGSFS